MSHRHLSRQPDRDLHPHPLIHHTPNGAPVVPPPGPNANTQPPSIIHKLNTANEQTWLLIGRVAEQMGDLEHALSAYENALRHNPTSVSGLTQVAGIARIKENYPKAVEFFQRVLAVEEDNGEIWSALGHCFLMQDDLQKAYSAYQQALYLLPNPKDPKLWYGIGILYDRYGSLDHAEEAFASVLRMCKEFDKENEILFRLGIIYKQQGKFQESLDRFDHILRNPPSPLAHADIWFQIGHVFEQQKNHVQAKDAYERVVEANPGHAKVLQQLGWLYHQDGSSFQNQELAIQYLTKSLEADPTDAQSWYLLGRAYMAGQKYNKAYEAYQQAVYRDGRNPTFWCSIGVLYFQINQFRDALDAYSRAIRINPYISEVWFDLGSLYESCNNQITDAIDAYARASELDPSNVAIAQRLQLLKTAQATGGQLPAAPGPQDVHPTAYASSVLPPPGLSGPPLMLHDPSPRPPPSHRNSTSSHHASPPPQPSQSAPLKRALSPGPEDLENNKRTRVDNIKRRISSPSGSRRTPVPSTRPSPIPFRTQAASHSPPEVRDQYPPSPSLPAVLPPHPRPIGVSGHAQVHAAPSASTSSIALPPIATLSPASTAPSPPNHNDRDDKMHVDSNRSSSPPQSRSKISDVIHPSSSRSPPTKQSSHSQSPPSEKESS
ncbi:hypothetical protein M413DRAFT_61592 [Hebeloma cylindrosporum]|uniref:Cytochrome c-type biogenesis protein H TPR domain-containing protein n=1 Tax=Hebeloma cylindrosporum TaxID=76867 RepID=A0A0C2YFE0_HEBCY|nr:hypothetical protein M413DRAFT_61592 [Hebeloma cylindrosporum h7]